MTYEQILNLIISHIDQILTFGLLIVALYALIITVISFSEHNRPYITFSYEEHQSGSYYYLIIRNTGIRAASNVNINISPNLKSYIRKDSEEISNITFDFIAPSQIIKYQFDYSLYRHNEQNGAKIEKHEIQITYKYKNRKFNDKYSIDLSYLKTWIGGDVESKSSKHLKDISDNLKKIETQLKK